MSGYWGMCVRERSRDYRKESSTRPRVGRVEVVVSS